ncbi:MAG: ABC transporter ATP-binding protein [Ruminococcaceae bacterium]|nr:ABC transporter ATP-binding protein [Oscillospiraceae bacterium]
MKLAKYLKPYWYFAILAPLFMIGEVAMDLMQPKLMTKIVDNGIIGGLGVEYIIKIGSLMLMLAILGGVFGIGTAIFASNAAQRFGNDLRNDVFKKVMGLSLEQTDKFTTGSLVTRLTNDINIIQDLVAMALRMFVRSPMMFIGGIVMCLSLDVNFGRVLLISLPLQVILIFIMLRVAAPLFSKVQTKLDKVNSVVQENVTGARVVKAYVREEYEIERFDVANTELKNINLKVQRIMAMISPVMMLIMNGSVIAIIYIGGMQVEPGNMLPGAVMGAITYITQILMSLMMVSMMFQTISRAAASAKRVIEVLNSDAVICDGEYRSEENGRAGSVEMKNVSFRYPGTKGRPVLDNINLKINPGEFVAVIGATGSGKTSLVNLITRFYDADEGEVLVDGVNVQDYDLHDLRSKIAFVLQKSELFSETVAENIRWGREDATDEEVIEASKTAQAHEFISSFNKGYDTMIAEKGASLSGGQKQRLAIARALIRKPEILIFDDSTSALDLATEAKLRSALAENMKDTTIIMIAQRIASIRNADRIAVIENGVITAFAPHDELMKTSEAYRDIYSSQQKMGGENNG